MSSVSTTSSSSSSSSNLSPGFCQMMFPSPHSVLPFPLPPRVSRKRLLNQERDESNKKVSSVAPSASGRYLSSLVIFRPTDGNTLCHKTYLAYSEQDAVREAVGNMITSGVINYHLYQETLKKYQNVIIRYKLLCQEKNVQKDYKLWTELVTKARKKKACAFMHVVIINSQGMIEDQVCDKTELCHRLYKNMKSIHVLKSVLSNIESMCFDEISCSLNIFDLDKDQKGSVVAKTIAENNQSFENFEKVNKIKDRENASDSTESDEEDSC
jgi:hypothetical protein